jgi:uncharacterized protein (TIGR02145 family)
MKTKNLFRTVVLNLVVAIVFVSGGCKDPDEAKPAAETGTVTDIDGNIYKTVKIGDQWWMAENLEVKTFRNGNPVANVTDSADWVSRLTGAYSVYENGNTQTKAPGILYNWHAVADPAGLAPEGWHIPSDDEWKKLEQYLGMSTSESDRSGWRGTNEGQKLKVESPEGWTPYGDVWSGNESGFTALAGSCRLANATYGQPGLFSTGFWWTSTDQGTEAWYRYLDYKNTNIFRSHESKNYGFSVRCVKD